MEGALNLTMIGLFAAFWLYQPSEWSISACTKGYAPTFEDHRFRQRRVSVEDISLRSGGFLFISSFLLNINEVYEVLLRTIMS